MNNRWLYSIFFFSLLIISLGFSKQALGSELNAKKDLPIIAFDLHGVVLTYDWSQTLPTIINFDQKWAVIKNLYKLPLRQLWNMVYDRPSFEQFLQVVGQGNGPLYRLLIELSVQQKLMPDMAVLINKLHQQGYLLHVVSNIGAESFRRLKNRFEIFHLFSVVVTSDRRDHNGCLIKKPDVAFFENYLNKIHSESDNVFVVDDRSDNVEAAHSIGMHAIQFRNARQLQDEFMRRGLLP